MTDYFKTLDFLANYIIDFGEKMGAYGELEAKNPEELKQIAAFFEYETKKAKLALAAFSEIEPPAVVKASNEALIALLEKYFFYTTNAINSLTKGDAGSVKEELILQDETAKKIVTLCKTF